MKFVKYNKANTQKRRGLHNPTHSQEKLSSSKISVSGFTSVVWNKLQYKRFLYFWLSVWSTVSTVNFTSIEINNWNFYITILQTWSTVSVLVQHLLTSSAAKIKYIYNLIQNPVLRGSIQFPAGQSTFLCSGQIYDLAAVKVISGIHTSHTHRQCLETYMMKISPRDLLYCPTEQKWIWSAGLCVISNKSPPRHLLLYKLSWLSWV